MPRTTRLRLGVAALALSAVFLLVACANGAAAENAQSQRDSMSSGSEAPSSGTAGEKISYTGHSEASVIFDASKLHFTGDGSSTGGMCTQSRQGVLEVELHLDEVDGEAYAGAGSNPELALEIPLPNADAAEMGGAHVLFAGGWVAGDTRSNVMKVGTPDITLVAKGATITGTQIMVPTIGAGADRAVEVEFQVKCS